MSSDLSIERVHRDVIHEFRRREHGRRGKGRRPFKGDMASTTRHWAALEDGVVVGCVSVMQLRGHALRGMAVAEARRRQGIGARMLRVVCAEVDAPIWCNARAEAVAFYTNRGWAEAGPTFELRDRGTHQRLTWTKALAGTETPRADAI